MHEPIRMPILVALAVSMAFTFSMGILSKEHQFRQEMNAKHES